MKKLLAVLFLLFAARAQAQTWQAYYIGASWLPKPGADALYESPQATLYAVWQPSSPTPPLAPYSNLWLGNPTSQQAYISLPTSIFAAQGTVAFYIYWGASSGGGSYDILDFAQTFSNTALRLVYDTTNQQVLAYEGATEVIATGGLSAPIQTDDLITTTYSSSAVTLQIGSGTVFSAAGYSPSSLTAVYVLGDPYNIPASGSSNLYLNGVAVGNASSGETYPPAVTTPTPSPSFTASPTPTYTPTYTVTATKTATPTDSPTISPTPSISPTPTYTVTATKTATPTDSPTISPTPTYTPTPTWTPTLTATPTASPTITPYLTATPNVAFQNPGRYVDIYQGPGTSPLNPLYVLLVTATATPTPTPTP